MRLISIVAVLTAGLCTTAFNWQFSYQLGRSEPEAIVWSTFSVALDVTKWTMLVIAARAWPSLNALAALLIWITAATYSFIAAFGFAATSRAHQELAARQYREHEATLEAARRSPLWQSTYACTQATSRQARDYCKALRDLQATPHKQPKEAQATGLASLLDIPEPTANRLLSLYLALTCEVISALGLYAILTPASRTERNPTWKTLARSTTSSQQPPATPLSSSSAGSSTPGSPTPAPRQSSSSSRRSWQRPKSWS